MDFLDKRGLSGIIIVLILVGIAILATGLVWYTINNVINTQVQEVGSSSDCLGVLLAIKSAGDCSSGATSCSVTVERRAGGGDISGFKVIVSDGLGTLSGNYNGSLGPFEIATISVNGTALTNDAETASVAALINTDSGKSYTCSIIDEYDY